MNDTLDISEVAQRLQYSERTVRNKMKERTIPQPIKRKSNRESLRWRTVDIDKFLGIKNQPAANDPAGTSLDAIIDARVEAKVRQILEEKIPAITQLIRQL